MHRTMYVGVLCGLGLLSSAQAAPYVFHEDFSAPPLTAGTPGNDYTDGWNNGDHGWEVSEGPGNVADSFYFSQRSDGPLFTGGDANIGVLRTDGASSTAAAIQDLPTDQDYVSGNVTFSVQRMLGSLGWGTYSKIFLVGDTGYATQIAFSNPATDADRIYVSQYSGAGVEVAGANTLTTNGSVLQWDGTFSPTAGHYATIAVDFDVNNITVTVSTTDALGNTSSIDPVSFPTDNGVTKFTRAGFFIQQSPNSNGLVYMSDFLLTANPIPEPATAGLMALGGAAVLLRRRRQQ